MRQFPPPWTVEKIPGGLNVCDANGQSLADVYLREKPSDAHIGSIIDISPPFLASASSSRRGEGLCNDWA